MLDNAVPVNWDHNQGLESFDIVSMVDVLTVVSYFCVKILEKQVSYWKLLGYNDIFFNWTELEGAERYLQGFLCDHQDGFIICPWKQPALNKDQLQCCIYNSFTLPL